MKTEASRPTARLYLVAALASVYMLAWWAFGVRTPERKAAKPMLISAPQPVRVALPSGWHVVETGAPARAAKRDVPAPVRVASPRPRRIRTRSS